MKKSKKSLISAVTVLSSVATIVAPATTALADTTNGWAVNGQSWNYYNNGAMVKNGWVQDAGKWYLMGADGSMVTGWAQAGGVWYYMGANGAMVTNTWTQDSAKNWYYMGANGAMVANGWVQDGTSKKWYFMAANGTMEVNKWIVSGGFNYYMGATGAMLTDTTTPDGYKVLANGAWDGKGKEVAVPEKLEIKSVTSINAAQIKVTFNKDLTEADLDEAEDLTNYTLNDVDGDEIDDVFASVDAEEGSDTAILTVKYSEVKAENYENQTSYQLVIDKDVVGKEVTKTFKVSDFEIPEAVSAEVAGIRTIKVIMSEPIVSDDFEKAFEVNDGDYSIEKVEAINNGKELNVVLFSDIEDGEELTVVVKSEAEDFAGYSLKKATLKIKADFDTSDLAIASYKKAEDNEITLVFNKDIKFSDDTDVTKVAVEDDTNKITAGEIKDGDYKGWKAIKSDSELAKSLYHSSSKNIIEAAEIDGNELTLYFGADDALPETAYVYVDADALEDLWEEKNNDLFIKVNATKDQAKPEVKTVVQDDDANDKIIITFSEDIDEVEAEKRDNYTVTDKNDDEVRVSKAEKTDTDEVTLTLSKDLENGDKYEVKVEDVEDKAGNKMSDTTKSFVAKETKAVDSVTARKYNEGESDQKIVVDFDTEMLADGSRYAINNLENYDLKIYKSSDDSHIKTINLSDYDDVTIKTVDNKTKVEIKVPGNSADEDDRWDFSGEYKLKLDINKLDDANENRSDEFTDVVIETKGTVTLDDEEKSPAATDLETITVVFGDELDFNKNDVMLIVTNETIASDSTDDIYTTKDGKKTDILDTNNCKKLTPSSTKVTKSGGTTTVVYTLTEADQLSFNGLLGDKVYVVTTKSTESDNSFGDKLVTNAVWQVKDEIAPQLALIDADSATPEAPKTAKLDDRGDYEDSVVVTGYDKGTNEATVELTFEEELRDNVTGKTYMFKTDDSDVKVTGVSFNSKVITLTLTASSSDFDEADDFVGVGITTGTNEVFDLANTSENGENGAVIDTEIEAVDTVALIEAYDANNGADASKMTIAELKATGATDVVTGNLAAYKIAVAAGDASDRAKIQGLVDAANDAVKLIAADAKAGNADTELTEIKAVVPAADLTDANISAYREAIAAASEADADTATEIATLISNADKAVAVITGYATANDAATMTEAQLNAAGITVTDWASNGAAIKLAVAALDEADADTVTEIAAVPNLAETN